MVKYLQKLALVEKKSPEKLKKLVERDKNKEYLDIEKWVAKMGARSSKVRLDLKSLT